MTTKEWLARIPDSFAASALVVSFLLSGCSILRPTVVPMTNVVYAAPCAPVPGAPHPLLVLLPGRFMGIDELVDEGFVDAVRQRGMEVDLMLVDAHLGYYAERSILERLQADVLEPARKQGVKQIWLAGISLGAYGAILYGDRRPHELAGLVALGPYLGEQRTSDRLRAGGGLRNWMPPTELPSWEQSTIIDEADERLWRWLKAQTADPPPGNTPPVFLGYGDSDRFASAHRLLAEALPQSRVLTHPGGHDWDAWRPLWGALLDRLPLNRRAGCTRHVQ